MRRFIEEIRVVTPQIAEKIIAALETRSEDRRDPVYEVDVFDSRGYDPCSNKAHDDRYIDTVLLKIFVMEEIVK